jgi:hypothetical protein
MLLEINSCNCPEKKLQRKYLKGESKRKLIPLEVTRP